MPRRIAMGPDKRLVEINMSGIPVAGVGGLGLVAMAEIGARPTAN